MRPEKLVKDFMRPLDRCYHIKEDDTVQEALRLMDKARKEVGRLCLFVVGEGSSDNFIFRRPFSYDKQA